MSDERVGEDSELRRRAAWLFGMLVLVAILIVTVMTALLGSDNNGGTGSAVGPDAITSTGPGTPTAPGSTPASSSERSAKRTPSKKPPKKKSTKSVKPSPAATTTTATDGPTTCPTSKPCAFDADLDNAIADINAYRAAKDLPAVPGSVSEQAKACALSRGSGCSGGWAETQVPKADGKLAVKKISQFAKFTDPKMKAIEVGWAYDPGSKTYYFATIRKD